MNGLSPSSVVGAAAGTGAITEGVALLSDADGCETKEEDLTAVEVVAAAAVVVE
jgi:hypothetical protein